MSIKKSKKQRGLENLIRKIVLSEILRLVPTIANEEVAAYDYEKSKPAVITPENLIEMFDDNLFPSLSLFLSEEKIKAQKEATKKNVQEMYESLGVPYGTPLYYGKGMKLKVYPEHLLPMTYTKNATNQ